VLDVPEELKNTDPTVVRNYKVIRVHEGEIAILDAVYDEQTGKISFETDAFSTYTLIYSDEETTKEPEIVVPDSTMPEIPGGATDEDPRAGYAIVYVIIAIVVLAITAGVVVLLVKKKH
jgi:hypothetical protein